MHLNSCMNIIIKYRVGDLQVSPSDQKAAEVLPQSGGVHISNVFNPVHSGAVLQHLECADRCRAIPHHYM